MHTVVNGHDCKPQTAPFLFDMEYSMYSQTYNLSQYISKSKEIPLVLFDTVQWFDGCLIDMPHYLNRTEPKHIEYLMPQENQRPCIDGGQRI
jgi:hypothetical protein